MNHFRAGRVDPDELRQAKIDRASLRRIWTFVRPYRVMLGLYLLAIVASAIIGTLPPLLVKQLIDSAIPSHNVHQVDVLAAAMVALALTVTGISLVNRWFGSVIGEGIIYDLRTAVRPRPAHAGGLLHPHPDRVADEPAHQRRARRPERGRHGGQRRSPT